MYRLLFTPFFLLVHLSSGWAQSVPVRNFTVGPDGRAVLEVNADADHYYLLQVRQESEGERYTTVSLTPGRSGNLLLTERLAAFPTAHYRVLRLPNADPGDIDADGTDDLTEQADLPTRSPLNFATPIDFADGTVALDNFSTFQRMSISRDRIPWSEFLNGRGHVKFIITDFLTERPKLWFINSERYDLHADFAAAIREDHLGEQVKRGQVIFHPASVADNGELGTFTFNFSNGRGDDFEVVQRTHELLAANIPFIENNLAYFITAESQDEYERDLALYEDSRVSLIFEEDVFGELDYWGLNLTEGYGIFREVGLDELPGPRDIVLYDALPNDLPRVAGIMTSVIQTPLSHVNVRALQNDLPNAFVRNPLGIDSIADLLDRPVYYRVDRDGFVLRAATLEEVNNWFDDARPTETQLPPLNLDFREILPLTDVEFGMSDAFGAKCANVATLLTFGFPEGTTPEGFGVPFYFYQEFMKFNGFFEEARAMITDPEFHRRPRST